MKEITVYEAIDGKRFDSKNDCLEYEILIDQVNYITNKLKPAPIVKEGCALQQDKDTVELAFKQFMYICANRIELCRDWFIDVAEGIRHMSHVSRILSDYAEDYPILNRTMFRFECINFKTGIEYPQPYYVKNPNEFKGTIL